MKISEAAERLESLRRFINSISDPPFPADVPGDLEALKIAADILASRAEPEEIPQWIPVSERLP